MQMKAARRGSARVGFERSGVCPSPLLSLRTPTSHPHPTPHHLPPVKATQFTFEIRAQQRNINNKHFPPRHPRGPVSLFNFPEAQSEWGLPFYVCMCEDGILPQLCFHPSSAADLRCDFTRQLKSHHRLVLLLLLRFYPSVLKLSASKKQRPTRGSLLSAISLVAGLCRS